MKNSEQKILLVGSFDPLHPGHVAMIEEAKTKGAIIIGLLSDGAVIQRKGFVFQPWDDRKKLLEAYATHIVEITNESFEETVTRLQPHYYGVGVRKDFLSKRECTLCEQLGITVIEGLGGKAVRDTTEITSRRRVMTRWGYYDVLLDFPHLKVKVLHIYAGKELSIQKHANRSEFFFMPNGEIRVNLPNVWHTLKAPPMADLTLVEVQCGNAEEDDIERMEDDSQLELNRWGDR